MPTPLKKAKHSLSILDNLTVGTPCPVPWETMANRAAGRHCGSCSRRVWDSTELTRNQFRAVVGLQGGSCCVRLTTDHNGTIVFKHSDAEEKVLRIIRGGLAAIPMATVLAAPIAANCPGLVAVAHADYDSSQIGTQATAAGCGGSGEPPCPNRITPSAEAAAPYNHQTGYRVTYGDSRMTNPTAAVLTYVEGTFGALVMALAGILSITTGLAGLVARSRKLAVTSAIFFLIAVGAFVFRTMTAIFFNDTQSY